MGVWVGGPGPHRPLRDRPQRPGAHTAQLVNRGGLVGRAPPRGLPGTAPGAAVQGSPADGPEGSAVRTAQRVFPNPSPTVRRGRPGRPGVGSGAGMLSAFAGAPLALLTWQAQGPPLVTGRYMPVRSGSTPGTASSRCPASPRTSTARPRSACCRLALAQRWRNWPYAQPPPQPRGSATNRPPPDITELADLALLAIQPCSALELPCGTVGRK